MSENKNITFDFLEILTQKIIKGDTPADDSAGNVIYDLDGVLNSIYNKHAQNGTLSETVLSCMGDKARIQKLIKHKITNIWEIQMLRLKETASFSGIASDSGDFILHNLDDGKYVGESTTVLYDPVNHLLLIQRNYGSLTPSGFEKYLNNSIKNIEIFFNVVMKKDSDIDDILSNIDLFRNIDIGMTFLGDESYNGNSELISTLYAMSKKGARNVRATLTVGQGALKKDTLSPGLSRETINELYSDKKTTKLSFKYKDNLDTNVETLDLLDNREQIEIKLRKPKKLALSHDIIFPVIYSEYCKFQRIENKTNIEELLEKEKITQTLYNYRVEG